MNCVICPRPLPETDADRYACRACEHQLRTWLGQLVRELPLLEAALVPGAGGPGGRPAGRAHAPLPVNVRVLDLLGPGSTVLVPDPHGEQTGGVPLGALLVGWAHRIAAEYPAAYRQHGTQYSVPCEGPHARTGMGIPAWCAWLTAYLPHAVHQPWITGLYDDLADATRRVTAVTGTRPHTHRYLAPCPSCAAFGLARTDGQWEIQCGVCGHRMEPDAYAAHATAVLPALTAMAVRMTTAELSAGAA